MKRFVVLFLIAISYLFLAFPVLAQTTPLKQSGCLAEEVVFVGGIPIGRFPIKGNVATLDCIPVIVGNVIFWLLLLAGIVALILIIISGFKFVTSGGEAKQAEGARKTLTYAIIGLIVILLSFAIISFIERTTGLNAGCITRFGFTQCAP